MSYHPMGNEHSSKKAQELSDSHECKWIASDIDCIDKGVECSSDKNSTWKKKNDCDDTAEPSCIIAGIRFITS